MAVEINLNGDGEKLRVRLSRAAEVGSSKGKTSGVLVLIKTTHLTSDHPSAGAHS